MTEMSIDARNAAGFTATTRDTRGPTHQERYPP
jgi:hypothetical protein